MGGKSFFEMADTTPEVPAETPKEDAPKQYTSIQDFGLKADRNSRHRRTMEDTHTHVDGFCDNPKWGYFGVYDGHGGKQAAEFVRDNLHLIVAEKIKEIDDKAEAFKQAYLECDKKIAEAEIKFSGTTVISALIHVDDAGVKRIYTANAGDARTVLARGGKGKRLSLDHKASDPEEVARIQAAGGFVVMNRVNGILAVARALGDISMKDFVSGEPYTECTEVTPEDTHLILACDGVWDVIEDDEAVELILKYDSCQKAATELLRASLKAGSTDNISVMVIKL